MDDGVARAACEALEVGDGDWEYPATWVRQWFWEPEQRFSSIGDGTIAFYDRDKDCEDALPVVVGFVRWRLRKERVTGPREYVGEIALLYIAPAYRGDKTLEGSSIASTIIATAEQAMRSHEKGSNDMPLRIDVNVGNEHARSIYIERWHFKHWKWRPEPPAEAEYEVLLRKPTGLQQPNT